jgi:hypothetical protein
MNQSATGISIIHVLLLGLVFCRIISGEQCIHLVRNTRIIHTRASARVYYSDPATGVVVGFFHAHRLSGVVGGVKEHPGTTSENCGHLPAGAGSRRENETTPPAIIPRPDSGCTWVPKPHRFTALLPPAHAGKALAAGLVVASLKDLVFVLGDSRPRGHLRRLASRCRPRFPARCETTPHHCVCQPAA